MTFKERPVIIEPVKLSSCHIATMIGVVRLTSHGAKMVVRLNTQQHMTVSQQVRWNNMRIKSYEDQSSLNCVEIKIMKSQNYPQDSYVTSPAVNPPGTSHRKLISLASSSHKHFNVAVHSPARPFPLPIRHSSILLKIVYHGVLIILKEEGKITYQHD